MRIDEMLLVNDLVEKLLRALNTEHVSNGPGMDLGWFVFSYGGKEVWRKAFVVISQQGDNHAHTERNG